MSGYEEEWQNGLCSHVCGGDCNTCLAAWYCPCFLAGRVSQRYQKFPETNKSEFSLWNGSCCISYLTLAIGFPWIPSMMQRGDIRARFHIKGNGCNDCLATFFCYPCSLAQMDMELKSRANGGPQGSDIKNANAAYGSAQKMEYSAAA